MRPLLVLLLVLAAVGALLFTIFKLTGSQSEQTGITGVPVIDDPVSERPDTALTGTADRDPIRVEPTPDRISVDPPAADASENSVVGIVKGSQGPLKGVKVSVTRSTPEASLFNPIGDTSEDITVVTDGEGRYVFRNVPPFEHYGVVARHPDYARKLVTGINVNETGEHRVPDLIMESGPRLYGEVYDETGQPIAGATLTLDGRIYQNPLTGDPDTLTVKSGPGGEYEFKNVSGTVHRHLMATAEGFEKQSLTGLDLSKDNRQVLRLKTAEMIGGQVLGPGDVPLEGARIMAISTPTTNKVTRDQVLSDSSGRFELTVSKGAFSISVSATGYKQQALQRIEAGDMNVTVRLVQKAIVSGRVLDETGKPVSAGTCRARRVHEHTDISSPTPIRTTFDSPMGKYELRDMPKGTYVIEAEAPGYAPSRSQPFTVVEGQQVPGIDVKLSRGGEIRGRLVDSQGKPIRGAVIQTHDKMWTDDMFTRALGMDMYPTNATSRSARSGNDGRFVVAGLNPESYQVRIKARGYATTVRLGVQVREGAPRDMGDVVMTRGGTVKGQIVDGSRKPVIAQVRLTMSNVPPGDPPISLEVKTGEDGRYAFNNVSAGNYKMRASRAPGQLPSANVLSNPIALDWATQDIVVKENSVITQDLTLGQ